MRSYKKTEDDRKSEVRRGEVIGIPEAIKPTNLWQCFAVYVKLRQGIDSSREGILACNS